MQDAQGLKLTWKEEDVKQKTDTTLDIILTATEEQSDYKPANLDDTLTELCLGRTIGQVCKTREHARNNRHLLGSSIIFDAVFSGPDMGLINQIVKRIDGLVPESGKRDTYANFMGDAINDVLDGPTSEMGEVKPDDPTIIALAKSVIYLAMAPINPNNYQAKKAKQDAVTMIMERTGGRKVEPVKPALETRFVDPDWMGLTDGGNE